ncbi:MAG: hypothetical protein Tsb0027_17990 [Wenzhouxiangellaceae bacterium]
MSRCLIDINDAGIRISDASGLLRQSPGLAFLQHGELLTGEQAAAQFRTNPRAGSDRFWHQLSQTPLPRALGPARTHADLAWYHLRELWTPLAADYDQVLLTVGGDFDPERLSTLLGIARACDMPVRSVVASAVAAAASHWQVDAAAAADEVVCVDAQWHRLLLEPLQISAGQVSTAATAPLQQTDVVRHGLAALYDRWAHMIAEAFLQRTRYDPLHNAASEQQLYDALPGWLQRLTTQPQLQLKLSAGGHDFNIELEREHFSAAAAELYAPLLQQAAARQRPLLLRQRLTLLPGLVEQLQQHAEVHVVADDTVSSHLLRIAADLISDDADAVRHHLVLALADADAKTNSAIPTTSAALPPTHLSDGVSLWRLDDAGLELPPPSPGQLAPASVARLLRHSDGRVSLQPGSAQAVAALQINAEPVAMAATGSPPPLQAGDRITVAGEQFVLLRLVH